MVNHLAIAEDLIALNRFILDNVIWRKECRD